MEENNNGMQPENNVEQQNNAEQQNNMEQPNYNNPYQQEGYYNQPNNMQQTQWQQQSGNPYQQQGYYNQPNNVQPTVGLNDYANGNVYMNNFGDQIPQTEPVPQKKGKGGKIALISVLAVIVIAAIVAVVFLFVVKTPEEVINQALTNTVSKAEEVSPAENMLGLSEIDTDDLDVEADLVINGLDETNALSGFDIIIDSSVEGDDDSSNVDFNIALSKNDEALNLGITYIEDVLYISLPEMYDDVWMLDLASIMDESSDDSERLEELAEEYLEPAITELQNSVEYEKIGSTTITNYNGDDVKCKQYTATLSSDAVADLLDAFIQYFDAYSDEFLDDSFYDDMGMTEEEFDSMLSYIPTYYKTIFTKDFEVNYYIADKQIVRISMDYNCRTLGIDLSVLLDYMGEEATSTDTYYEIAVDMDDTLGEAGTYMVSGTKTTKENGDETTVEHNLVVEGNGEEYVNLVVTSVYDTEANTYDITMSIVSENETLLAADLEGSFEDIDKGKSFTMVFDSFTVTDSYGDTLLDISGDLKYGNLGKKITKPDSSENVVNLEDLDDDYITDNFNLEKFESILEAWGIDDSYDYDDYDYDDYDYDYEYDDYNYDDDDYDTDDYSGINIEGDGYEVAINEPDGYERYYASAYSVSIEKEDDYSVYVDYELYEDYTVEEMCDDFASYLEDYSEDWYYIGHDVIDVTPNGEETLKCFYAEEYFYGETSLEYDFFYPVTEDDYLVVCVYCYYDELLSGDTYIEDEAQKMADLFVNSNVISVIEAY